MLVGVSCGAIAVCVCIAVTELEDEVDGDVGLGTWGEVVIGV